MIGKLLAKAGIGFRRFRSDKTTQLEGAIVHTA